MANQPNTRGNAQSSSMTRSGGGERGVARRQFEDPFSLMEAMFDHMQREFFGAPLFSGLLPSRAADVGWENGVRVPRMQVRDAGTALKLTAELPGIEPDNVRAELEGDLLTISAETRGEEDSEGARTARHVSFYRQITLPDGIDADSVESSFRNGVLSLRFPRHQTRRNTRQIPINTGPGAGQESGQQERAQQ